MAVFTEERLTQIQILEGAKQTLREATCLEHSSRHCAEEEEREREGGWGGPLN